MIYTLTKRRNGFTIVEIMIVVAIIALITAIAVPSFLRARSHSQATTMLNNLRIIDAAKEQYAVENGRPGGPITTGMVAPYLKPGTHLHDWAVANPTTSGIWDTKFEGIGYHFNDIGEPPALVSHQAGQINSILEVTGMDFWSPFSVHP